MSQTTTPSGGAVISDPVTETGEGALHLMLMVQKALERYSLFSWAKVQAFAFDTVAALLARNAELEAERDDALTACSIGRARISALSADNLALRELVEAGRRAIGEHIAPEHCYSTGPLTGNPILDLVECPACAFMATYDARTPAKGNDNG